VNHHVVEQAPGDGRLIRRPLLGADGSCATRENADRSNGQEEHAGLAYSMGDGPASQARHRPASFGPHRNSTKRRPALNDEAHNMTQRAANKTTEKIARKKILSRQNRLRELEVDGEGNSFGNAPRRKRRKDEFCVALP
jgi:hypothetical protein